MNDLLIDHSFLYWWRIYWFSDNGCFLLFNFL